MSSVPPIKDWIARIRPYQPGKPLEEVERELGISDAIKLASNENPLGPSPLALAAIRDAASRVALYPEDTCFYLKRDLADRLSVPESWLFLGNGSDEVLHCAAMAFLRPGEEAVYAHPSFVMYETNTLANGGKPVVVPLRDWKHDLDAMADRLNTRTRMVFIANPNNPTGTYNTREELDRFLARTPDHVLVILDEAYYEYVEAGDYPHSLDYVRAGANVVVTRTFSKIFALAGLRVGYGIARPEIIAALQQVRPPFNVNSLAQAAARASLADPQQVPRSQAMNREGRLQLESELSRLGLGFVPTQANFLLVDVKTDTLPVYEGLLKRGVVVRRGDWGTPTHLRVTIGTFDQNARFIEALARVLRAGAA